MYGIQPAQEVRRSAPQRAAWILRSTRLLPYTPRSQSIQSDVQSITRCYVQSRWGRASREGVLTGQLGKPHPQIPPGFCLTSHHLRHTWSPSNAGRPPFPHGRVQGEAGPNPGRVPGSLPLAQGVKQRLGLSGHQSPGSQADQRLQCPVCPHAALARAERPRRTQNRALLLLLLCPLSQAASPPPHMPTTPPGDSQPAGCCFSDSQIQGGSGGTVNGPQVHVPRCPQEGRSVPGNPELPLVSVCFPAPDRTLLCVAFYFWLCWVFVATCRLSLVEVSRTFSSCARSSHGSGFSGFGAQTPGYPGFHSCPSAVAVLSSWGTWA